jgi:cytoskeletal protein CcmA (bactofilin family)
LRWPDPAAAVFLSRDRDRNQQGAAVSFMSKDYSAVEARPGAAAKAQPDIVTTFGPGMLVTGNVVCAGAVQVFGRVLGDIRAAHLIIGEGAYVEGNVTALDAIVQGSFKGTIHGNTVKLQGNARIEGEVYNKSLSIEPNVVFEGSSRRLDRPVDAPSANEVAGNRDFAPLAPSAEPLDLMPQQYAGAPAGIDNDVLV